MTILILVLLLVLAAGLISFSHLPLTVIYGFSLAAFLASAVPHTEPLHSVLQIARVPAALVTDVGSSVTGLGTQWAAGIFFGIAFMTDLLVGSALKRR